MGCDRVAGAADLDISGLAADSREVHPGYLFAALPGSRFDGLDFVGDALDHGAVAVLAGRGAEIGEARVPLVTDDNPRRRLALMAARFYGAQPDTIAAVTGTSGKTSVTDFTRQIWSRMGYPAASLGTLGVLGATVKGEVPHTTPEPVTLHRILAELARGGVARLALEASSHGLDQCRLDGVRVGAAAFTNLSREHLDYHETPQSYLKAKLRLFDEVMAPGGVAVLNVDADDFELLRQVCEGRGHRILTYGASAAELRLAGRRSTPAGQRLEIEIAGASHQVELALVGGFQAWNVLCALGLVLALGGEAEAAFAALPGLVGVPGRMELVAHHPSGAPVFVDYAHKPDALAQALTALKPEVAGQLRVVIGCGGERDPGKRPLMGRVAAELADLVIVTDDNPRGEDPAAIRRAVLEACPDALEVGARAAAIRAGLDGLGADDALMVAGKGHERGQVVGGETLPFEDAAEVRAAIAEIGGSGS
jgi:UDP-N-acetylmuramoyl-L-alanyl-D-glutamate--2,6-diaminopimelate ligase